MRRTVPIREAVDFYHALLGYSLHEPSDSYVDPLGYHVNRGAAVRRVLAKATSGDYPDIWDMREFLADKPVFEISRAYEVDQ